MTMADREKVIKGLECCTMECTYEHPFRCKGCPYSQDDAPCEALPVMRDALALLKEHGHGETFIVIDSKTGKEADTYNIALYEDWAKELCYCDMEGWAITDDGTLLLVDECGRFAYADRERFKVKWE